MHVFREVLTNFGCWNPVIAILHRIQINLSWSYIALFKFQFNQSKFFPVGEILLRLCCTLWGKYDESQSNYHCLEHHCADVAACFEILIQEPVLRSRFTLAANIDRLDSVTEARLTVIAFLHDFAKLNSGFQFKVRDQSKLPPNPPPKNGAYWGGFFLL